MTRKQKARTAHIAAPRKLWLAGLGIAAVAQQRGEQAIEEISVRVADGKKQLAQATKRARRTVDGYVAPVRARAERTRSRIELEVTDQVGAAFGRLGIPSRNEVAALMARVEQLRRQVQAKAKARAAR